MDCGDGYDCVAQFSGGSLCFKTGTCSPEACNGRDDNCDGRVDESFMGMGAACMTGQAGPCAMGTNICSDGGVVCLRGYTPTTEVCNGIDDDCVNGVDDTFDFATDNLHCGSCSRACATGSQCSGSACHETTCDDGIDNDADDAGTDCLDSDCLTLGCGLDGGFNCGARPSDAGTADAGDPDGGTDAGIPLELACVPREAACDDALDDDFDQRIDCADSDCNGKVCKSDGGVCSNGMCP